MGNFDKSQVEKGSPGLPWRDPTDDVGALIPEWKERCRCTGLCVQNR